jgi:hypothetical protein
MYWKGTGLFNITCIIISLLAYLIYIYYFIFIHLHLITYLILSHLYKFNSSNIVEVFYRLSVRSGSLFGSIIPVFGLTVVRTHLQIQNNVWKVTTMNFVNWKWVKMSMTTSHHFRPKKQFIVSEKFVVLNDCPTISMYVCTQPPVW